MTQVPDPVPMLLWCPQCRGRHIDLGDFATTRVHHTHSCQHCGFTWRPAIVNTVGVEFLPGFKNEGDPPAADRPFQADNERLRRLLEALNERGRLGHDVHRAIDEVLGTTMPWDEKKPVACPPNEPPEKV